MMAGTSKTESAAAWCCGLFAAILIVTIPLGGSTPGWVLLPAVVLAVCGFMFARTRTERWSETMIWQPMAIVVAMVISMAACHFTDIALERSVTTFAFVLLIPAVQIACWRIHVIRTIGASACFTVVAINVDVLIHLILENPLFPKETRASSSRITGSFGNPNDLVSSSMLIPIAALTLVEPKSRWRIALIPISAPSWLFGLSRQVFLGWMIASLAVIQPKLGSWRTWAITLTLLIVVTALITINPDTRDRVQETMAGKLGGRPILIAFGISLFLEHPWTGIGPSLFGEYYALAANERWEWHGRTLRRAGMPWVHNIPLELLIEYGVVGFGIFSAVFIDAYRSIRRGLVAGEPARMLAVASRGTLIVIAMVGMVDLSFIKDWFQIVLWTGIGLAIASGRVKSGIDRELP